MSTSVVITTNVVSVDVTTTPIAATVEPKIIDLSVGEVPAHELRYDHTKIDAATAQLYTVITYNSGDSSSIAATPASVRLDIVTIAAAPDNNITLLLEGGDAQVRVIRNFSRQPVVLTLEADSLSKITGSRASELTLEAGQATLSLPAGYWEVVVTLIEAGVMYAVEYDLIATEIDRLPVNDRIFTGAAAPEAIPAGGRDNDKYLNTTTGEIYELTLGTWILIYTPPDQPEQYAHFITAPSATADISNYPDGYSATSVDAAAGWPEATGTITTSRYATTKALQLFSGVTDPAGVHFRSALGVAPTAGTFANGSAVETFNWDLYATHESAPSAVTIASGGKLRMESILDDGRWLTACSRWALTGDFTIVINVEFDGQHDRGYYLGLCFNSQREDTDDNTVGSNYFMMRADDYLSRHIIYINDLPGVGLFYPGCGEWTDLNPPAHNRITYRLQRTGNSFVFDARDTDIPDVWYAEYSWTGFNTDPMYLKLAASGRHNSSDTDTIVQWSGLGVGGTLQYLTEHKNWTDWRELPTGESTTTLGALIASATTKDAIADADIVGFSDATGSPATILKKSTWANIKSLIQTALKSVFAVLGGNGTNQTLNGGVNAGDTLTLSSTAHGTKGKILFGTSAYDEVNNLLGVGTAAPTLGKLQVRGTLSDGTSNVLIITNQAEVEHLQVKDDGRVIGISTAANEVATIGAEILDGTGWTTTGWTGNFATGFTHTVGNTTSLTRGPVFTNGGKYLITYTVTGRTTGSFTITGGSFTTTPLSSSGTWYPHAGSTGGMVIAPTTDFNGTVVLSVKLITPTNPMYSTVDSNGVSEMEIRSSNATLMSTCIGKNAGRYLTTGVTVVALGNDAASELTTGTNCTFIGANAGMYCTTGINNIAIGSSALRSVVSGAANVAIGTSSLYYCTAGSNTAVGQASMRDTTGGSSNVAVGALTLLLNTTGTNNTAIGALTLGASTTPNNNTAVGYSSLSANTIGSGNTAIGTQAMLGNNVGINNTAIGFQSLVNNMQASSIVAVGHQALANLATGTEDTAIGFQNSYYSSSASYNTSVGFKALFHNQTGNANTVVGDTALHNCYTGSGNTVIGYLAITIAPTLTAAVAAGGSVDVGSSHLYVLSNTIGGALHCSLGVSATPTGTNRTINISGMTSYTGPLAYTDKSIYRTILKGVVSVGVSGGALATATYTTQTRNFFPANSAVIIQTKDTGSGGSITVNTITGSSSTVEPTWNTATNSFTEDNGVLWQCTGSAVGSEPDWTPSTTYTVTGTASVVKNVAGTHKFTAMGGIAVTLTASGGTNYLLSPVAYLLKVPSGMGWDFNKLYKVGSVGLTDTTYSDTKTDIEIIANGALGANISNSIAIGSTVQLTGSGQCVIGDSSAPVYDTYLGGVYHKTAETAGLNHTIHAMGGNGTDKAGGALNIAGGKGTGTGLGGAINFQIAAVSTTGSLENTLVTKATLTETLLESLVPVKQTGSIKSCIYNAGTYQILSSDYTILSAGTFTKTLPAAPVNGQTHVIKKVDAAGTTTTIGRNGKNIEGAATDLTITTQNESVTLQYCSDGSATGWWII